MPVVIPVMVPVVFTVAMAVLLLDQVPPEADSVAVMLAPAQTPGAVVMVPALGAGLTVITDDTVKVPQGLVTV